jgi:hypothetical protein
VIKLFKRLIKKSSIELYHGTNLNNAIKILETMTIKGSIVTGKQKQPMYSLTDEEELAEEFGPIIFEFNGLNNLTKIVYEEEWFKKNPNIAAYVFCGGYNDGDPACMKTENEYIGIGDLHFNELQVSIFLSDKLNQEESSEAFNTLSDINPNIKIKVSY